MVLQSSVGKSCKITNQRSEIAYFRSNTIKYRVSLIVIRRLVAVGKLLTFEIERNFSG